MEADDHMKSEAIVCAILAAAAVQKAPLNPMAPPALEAVSTYKTILRLMRDRQGPFSI